MNTRQTVAANFELEFELETFIQIAFGYANVNLH